MKGAVALALVACATALAACGGSSGSSSSSAASAPAKPKGGGGAALFTSAGCGACHTLAAARASGAVGPNLDELKPDAETVAQQVTNGGGGMPAFRGRLTPAQIQAVAQFVAQNAGG